MDDFKSLSRGSPSLVLRESVQPLEDRLDVLLSEKFLHKLYCAEFKKVSRQQERTHLAVPA